MNKFYETLTNLRSDVLFGYRAQVVDETGASVDIYRDRSGTRFTDGSGNIVNYAEASSDTGMAEFYWTAATGQLLQITDSAGELARPPIIGFGDNYVLGNLSGDLPTTAIDGLDDTLAAKADTTYVDSGLAEKVPTADLASTDTGKGAGLVGWMRDAVGAYARTIADWLDDRPSVMDFIPFAERVKIRLRTSTADAAPYFQAALNYMIARGGGTLLVPNGDYNLLTSIVMDTGVYTMGLILQGEGRNTILRQTGAGQDAIKFSTTQYLQNSGIRDMRIFCDNDAGHCIHIVYGCTTCFFTNVELNQNNTSKRLIYGDWSVFGGGVYDTKFSGGSWVASEVSTEPAVQFIVNGPRFNENIFENLRCYNAKTEQFFDISTVTTGSLWLSNNVWRNINFEVCPGGGIRFDSFKNATFQNVSFWDAQGNYVNHLIEMVSGVGIESISNTFINVGRNGDALNPGVYDIKIASGQDTALINCYTQSGDAPAFDFGNKRVNIIGPFSGTITNGSGVFQLGSQFGEIKFPGTINGSFLTYYDEGTWTATLSGSGGAPTTPVTATGVWTRIGRLVHLSVEFTNVDTTGASGNVAVTGLPFTANATHRDVGPTAMAGFGTTAAVARAAGTQIQLFQSTSRTTNITHADGGAPGPGKYLSLSISFIV